jgi:hypothetical protein
VAYVSRQGDIDDLGRDLIFASFEPDLVGSTGAGSLVAAH